MHQFPPHFSFSANARVKKKSSLIEFMVKCEWSLGSDGRRRRRILDNYAWLLPSSFTSVLDIFDIQFWFLPFTRASFKEGEHSNKEKRKKSHFNCLLFLHLSCLKHTHTKCLSDDDGDLRQLRLNAVKWWL